MPQCNRCGLELPDDYPGRFCINCGREIAEVEAREGQLVLRRGDQPVRYLAVLHGGQRRVSAIRFEITDEGASYSLQLQDGERVSCSVGTLIAAFQDPLEVFKIS